MAGEIGRMPSTEVLLQRIREEARYLELDPIEDSMRVEPALPIWSPAPRDFPVKRIYHVNEFTQHDDIDFVVNAYRGLLHREPDESGFDQYVALLREKGPAEKMAIILNLLESQEGQSTGVYLQGMRWEKFEFRHHKQWWFKLKLFKRLFTLGRRLQRNNLQEFTRQNEATRAGFERKVDRYLAQQGAVFESVQSRQQELHDEQGHMHAGMSQYRRDLLLTRQDSLAQQRRLNLVLKELEGKLAQASESAVSEQVLAGHADAKFDAFYLAFENECRGDEAEIREQLRVYLPSLNNLPTLTDATPLLDVGCGRGEWLSLLRDEGLPAYGVDVSGVLAEHCREQALQVDLGDGIEHLRARDSHSLGAISAFHVIEHLSFESLFSLVEECQRVLLPGAIVIFETPNPENVLVGSHTFYHDPTHRNPITPTLISFLLRYLGFAEIEIERLHPYPDEARVIGIDPLSDRVNGAFCGAQDFAVIARKPQ